MDLEEIGINIYPFYFYICFNIIVILQVAVLVLTLHMEVVWTANILAFFVVSPMSHIALKSTLLRELASRGHRVTVVSPVAEKDPPPNYEEIIVDKIPSANAKYGKLRQ